jgi:hypothetical protein
MIEIMSDAIAINFLLMMAKDWQRKGKPENKSSLEHKKLRKNAVILLDRSVYEYVTKKWRGSSDSRIATNLKTMSAMPDLFEPIPHEAWDKLIEEVIEEGKIEAVFYATGNDKRIKLLLCYYYCIECIGGPKSDPLYAGTDLDHIIPKTQFESSPRADLRPYAHNIINQALLPRKQNISKSDDRLDQISDGWMIRQIEKYEEITQGDFPKYSDVTQVLDLKEYRGKKLRKALCVDRKNMIDRAP